MSAPGGREMKTYPIMLDVTGRVCVVVGAGPVGRRKAEALARAGAVVRLVDPGPSKAAPPAGVERIEAAYDPAVLDGALLVFACTDEAALNARVAADARRAAALVNVADDPARCDFLAAATVADGEVVVAVGTGGSSPALAAALRRRIARQLPDRLGEFAAALSSVRRHVHERTARADERKRVLTALAGEAGYEAFLRAGLAGLIEQADADIETSP